MRAEEEGPERMILTANWATPIDHSCRDSSTASPFAGQVVINLIFCFEDLALLDGQLYSLQVLVLLYPNNWSSMVLTISYETVMDVVSERWPSEAMFRSPFWSKRTTDSASSCCLA